MEYRNRWAVQVQLSVSILNIHVNVELRFTELFKV